MIIRRSLEWLGGSVLVYVVVVACGTSSPADRVADAGSSGRSGSAGNASRGGAPSAGGMTSEGGLGGFLAPVPDAGASEAGDGPGPETCECPEPAEPYVPPAPLVIVAECDVRIGSASSGQLYAEIERPELPEENLLLGVPVFEYEFDPQGRPAGHRSIAGSGVSISDATVGVACGTYGTGSADPPSAVRFIFPRT